MFLGLFSQGIAGWAGARELSGHADKERAVAGLGDVADSFGALSLSAGERETESGSQGC